MWTIPEQENAYDIFVLPCPCVAAKAVTDAFGQRDVDTNAELVDAIKNLTLTLKS